MIKEHLIQFGVGFDEDELRERVYKSAEKAIVKELTEDFKQAVFETDRWNNKIEMSDWMKNRVNEFLTEHQDLIIEKAALALADKMARMKAVKAVAAQVAEGG